MTMSDNERQCLISIIVPVYNVEQYLHRCVESIVRQTYENIEILLVDDGSPDNCPALCDQWKEKDPRISVIHKNNQGLGMARNTGIEHAHGEYLCFVDSDDYIESDMIEKAMAAAEKNHAQAVIYGMIKERRDGSIISVSIPNKQLLVFEGNDIKTKMIPAMVSSDYYSDTINDGLSCCEILVSKDAVDKNEWRLVSEREIISEDVYSLLTLYSFLEKVVVIPRAFYHYCQNEGSLTKTYRKDRLEKILDFHKRTIQLIIKSEYPEGTQSGICAMCFSFLIGMLKTIVRSNLPTKKKIKEFRKAICNQGIEDIINGIDVSQQKPNWKILLKAMKYKLVILSFFLIKVKS